MLIMLWFTNNGVVIIFISSINDFVQEEQPIVLDEQLKPQEHGWVRWQPTRNRQPARSGIGGHRRP